MGTLVFLWGHLGILLLLYSYLYFGLHFSLSEQNLGERACYLVGFMLVRYLKAKEVGTRTVWYVRGQSIRFCCSAATEHALGGRAIWAPQARVVSSRILRSAVVSYHVCAEERWVVVKEILYSRSPGGLLCRQQTSVSAYVQAGTTGGKYDLTLLR